MEYFSGKYDIAVVGAGHAGIEAALAPARMGCSVICFCTSLDAVGNMPCNPSIGGTAKGQLVREIDALGGEMGKAAENACLQFRMLNRGKGPAVFSPRAQADRMAYRIYMRKALESEKNLSLRQGEIVKIEQNGDDHRVFMRGGAYFDVKAVVLATGTYLKGKTFTGDVTAEMGPDGMYAATELTDSLRKIGLEIRRFKTGTPMRLDGRTIDFSVLEPQYGDENEEGFVFKEGETPLKNELCCYLTYTNEKTHEIIRASLDRSPLYNGSIDGIGPRYCPSIEVKIVNFPDKKRHQIFLEPCGANTREIYVQGLSTSLPEDVQVEMVHSVPGLENALLTRPGYAIEYDCINPLELDYSLQAKKCRGLFCAGQLCGSSGYEEAAAQGLVAGINAALYVKNEPPFVLARCDGYIGTLIDDLVTRGTNEPYRMMTSRCEYRLICRQDNADARLMDKGFALGLVSKQRLDRKNADIALVNAEKERLEATILPPNERTNAFLLANGTSTIEKNGASLADLLRRPQISYEALAELDDERPDLPRRVRNLVETEIKYAGYIRRQTDEIEQQRKLEDKVLPDNIEYMEINTLRIEARQKLDKIKPHTLGQASRISGVSPADVGALLVYLAHREEKR